MFPISTSPDWGGFLPSPDVLIDASYKGQVNERCPGDMTGWRHRRPRNPAEPAGYCSPSGLNFATIGPGETGGVFMVNLRKPAALLVAAASIAGLLSPITAGAETLKAVMNSDLKIVDPIWTTAYVQRG